VQTGPTASHPVTEAGKAYLEALTAWLQDTRLMSEAVFRLKADFEKEGRVPFDVKSWPKRKTSDELTPFQIKPVALAQRMDSLLANVWRNRFVFLETLWEEYLETLVTELRHKDAKLFEPFCERDFVADIVREVLTDRLNSIDEIKDEVASRFAAGLTRRPWEEQWKQLSRLEVGLSEKDNQLAWFSQLDVYFEMRNCIIHRQCRISPALRRKDAYYSDPAREFLEIWPPHLDHHRHQFIDCLLHIEGKIAARYGL
jgi:hypothetical protein